MEPNIYIYNELIVKIADVKTATNSGLAKVAVPCSADPFVVNQTLVLRISICGKNRRSREVSPRVYDHLGFTQKRAKPCQ